ncbi:MAG: T9SS type A sorting domain-containing protein [Saprospiraceae bacterium]|nr:right-handed parallel beta-helix repeat-containing protein [Saprospiraceae bacterium]MBK8450374.1 right-handed parallel beta-helix repeat-containing protein [Saprospiraceae bacterium]MBK8485545.1 right-handed parallel beta-helix repeat-containing protein [Saprospiraceae bacterium]MBK9727179.1 right-handed parallel beta-helix repeat-containing protein [Saprospiraceae bacterium]
MNWNFLFVFMFTSLAIFQGKAQTILNVGPGRTYSNPAQAAAVAKPGDTILIHPASYTGTFFIENLKGSPAKWIYIRGTNKDQVIFQGGTESMHFSDPNYLHISNITIAGQTGNGMNIDDGGSYDSPAKKLVIDQCIFKNIAATGNNDMLKLSGLDSFVISNCIFENGAAGGSGIDMVGCHVGTFIKNKFTNMGSNSIQAKGGTSNLHIERNYFVNGGQRSLNLGGSTGAAFFRPIGANYEAKDLLVTANIFEGSWCPIAYVGSRNVVVSNNTIIQPQNWIIRILQESSDTSYYQSCANNSFNNNIVVVTNSLSTDVNIGPNTLPATFKFSNNLWYHLQNTSWRGPQLPTPETNAIIQKNPLFTDFANKNYNLTANSPAIGKGKPYNGILFDYADKQFKNPPSIGAFEGNLTIANKENNTINSIELFPNPATDYIILDKLSMLVKIQLTNLNGQLIEELNCNASKIQINIKNYPVGLYVLNVLDLKTNAKKLFIIQKI